MATNKSVGKVEKFGEGNPKYPAGKDKPGKKLVTDGKFGFRKGAPKQPVKDQGKAQVFTARKK